MPQELSDRARQRRQEAARLRALRASTDEERRENLLLADQLDRQSLVDEAQQELLTRWRDDPSGSPTLVEHHRKLMEQRTLAQAARAQATADEQTHQQAKAQLGTVQTRMGKTQASLSQAEQTLALLDAQIASLTGAMDQRSAWQRWRESEQVRDDQKDLAALRAQRTTCEELANDFRDLHGNAQGHHAEVSLRHATAQRAYHQALLTAQREERAINDHREALLLAEHHEVAQQWNALPPEEQQRRIDAVRQRRAASKVNDGQEAMAIEHEAPWIAPIPARSRLASLLERPTPEPSAPDLSRGHGYGRSR